MRDSALSRLSMYYLAGRVYRARPRTILFSPTLQCNLRCLHCGIWSQKAEVPTRIDPARWSDLLAHPLFRSVAQLWIGGGEPTLMENTEEYFRAGWERLPELKALGFITNGFLANRAVDLANRLLEAMPSGVAPLYLHLSIDGPPEIHDRIRGVPGAFRQMEKVVDAISRRPKDGRWEILFNCVLQPANVEAAQWVLEWGRNRGGHTVFNLLSRTEGFYCNSDPAADLEWTPRKREEAARFIERLAAEVQYPIRGHYQNVIRLLRGGKRSYRCVAMEGTFHLDGDGRTWACPVGSHWTVGNVLDEDPEVLWRGRKFLDFKGKISEELCPECGLSCSIGDGMDWHELVI